MNLISLATSRWGPSLCMFLCRVLPQRAAYRLARWVSSHLARQKDLPFVQSLRANMAVVQGLPADHPQLDQAVAELLYNMACGYIDLFRMVAADPGHASACQFDESLNDTVQACLASGRGLVLVGIHTCSFDLLLLELARLFPSVQVLSKTDPKGSSPVMNEIRARFGLNITPISVGALRQAVEGLRRGGVLAIAADIPLEAGEELIFFGRKSCLGVGHARLALGAKAMMVVGASCKVGEGTYRVEVAPVPRPLSTGNRKQDVIQWAQAALTTVERFIGNRPEEWLMPHPVWSGSAAEHGAV